MSYYDFFPFDCAYTVREVNNGLIAFYQSESGADETLVWSGRDGLGEDIKRNIVSVLTAAEEEESCALTHYKIRIEIERIDEKGGAA